ncbi:hypothetical protein [Olleya namhaensis]|uniref:hypothetical protein n=1 Tax=Olleya namhaensis TaxID=1144750 RepID=UPI00248FD227|nr:hypothetical protein [Olleya namhaensis]
MKSFKIILTVTCSFFIQTALAQTPTGAEMLGLNNVPTAELANVTAPIIGSLLFNPTDQNVYMYTTAGWTTINNANDLDGDTTNELNTTVVLNGTNLETTDAGGTITTNLASLTSTVTPVVTTGNTIATHTSGTTTTNITESNTSLVQNATSATGEITYTNESGIANTAQVIAAETDNQIEVGANGGAYLGPTVYTGTFIISAEGTTTVTGIPFQPSQVTFVANANVESLDIDSDNAVGDNARGISNSFGTMNGFARNTNGTLVQQSMYSGGHGNSINDNSRYASSSNCIGVRYGDQNGSSLGKIEGAFNAFTPDGFTIAVNYTNGVITVNSTTATVNVQPGDVNNESLLVMYTAYK